ncbi:MAG TPA: PatB family C-S lyase [Candidatus Limnocylindrales bacterium]|nr:PatB family C-S lyase [Candidatus Limnocylindrales bacterium]
MTFSFDHIPNRRGTSIKWDRYPEDVLPLWVADMDFPSPPAVAEALLARVQTGLFGYEFGAPALSEVLAARMRERHSVPTTPGDIVFLPGLVFGLNMVARAIGAPGSPILMAVPVYFPFMSAAANFGRPALQVQMAVTQRDGFAWYELDFDALEAAVTPETSVFMVCNPHNPVGRAFTRSELEQLAEFCLRHNLVICSDEIHADLLHPEGAHISLASLGADVAARTITLVAPSKTFNVPGLNFSAAVITDPELRAAFEAPAYGLGAHAAPLGLTGALAAYTEGEPWLREVLVYLTGNREALIEFVHACWPNVPITRPEATYLAWLDFRALALPEGPYDFFLNRARVALSDGAPFGPGGAGHVRLNYGTSRALLMEALQRMDRALHEAGVQA